MVMAALVLLTLSACGTLHYKINEPLAQADPSSGYRMRKVLKTPENEELFIVLTFSGGGTRAAALAFGVLEELAHTQVNLRGRNARMIDEVDLVYGVSGGSIAAAYWGFAGDRALGDFEQRFLSLDLQSQLVSSLTSVSDMFRLSSPRFGRGEILEERLDSALFQGATFGDLMKRKNGPFVVISAADLNNGTRFDFTQDYFDLLCSDLSSFPIARAVAASSSVPLVFSPIALWNYAGTCNYSPSALVALGTDAPAPRHLGESREQQRAREMADYLNASERPYVHLVDGGVADNLAARGLLEMAGEAEKAASVEKDEAYLRRIVIITVDAGTDAATDMSKSADIPTFSQIVPALSV